MFCCCIFSTCDIQSSTTTFIDNIPLISTRGDSTSYQQPLDHDDDIIGEEVRPSPVNTLDTRLQSVYAILNDHTYSVPQKLSPTPPPAVTVASASAVCQLQPISRHCSTGEIATTNSFQNAISAGSTLHVFTSGATVKPTSTGYTFIYNPTGKQNTQIKNKFLQIILPMTHILSFMYC